MGHPVAELTFRDVGIPADAGPILAAWNNSSHINTVLKANSDYAPAKCGDAVAALRLVRNTVPTGMLREARSRWPGRTFLFGTAYDQGKVNHIPAALAWHLSQVCGGDVGFLIRQNSVCHTGANAAERLLCRPIFTGSLCAEHQYVLVDDVVVLGNTLAEMANFVVAQGASVSGVAVLVNASRMNHFVPTQHQVNLLRLKYDYEIENSLAIRLEALTRQEANYLARFKNADSFRNRLARTRDKQCTRFDARAGRAIPSASFGLEAEVISALIDAVDQSDGDADFEAEPVEDNGDAEAEGANIRSILE